MNSLVFTFTFCCITLVSNAQLDPAPVSFWNHYDQFNPAMSALEYKQHAAITYRNQSPALVYNAHNLQANYSTKIASRHGIGINSRIENNYFYTNFRVAANYNYKIILKDKHRFSFGAAVGVDDHSLKSKFQDEYPQFVTDKTSLDFSTGIAYTNNKLLLGFGVTRIGTTALRTKGTSESINPFQSAEQFYVNAAYAITLSQHLELKPQVLFQTSSNLSNINLNLLLTLKKKYWIAGTYYGRSSFAGMIGWDIKEKYRIGYTYQQYTSKLINGSHYGSHEFTLGFLLR